MQALVLGIGSDVRSVRNSGRLIRATQSRRAQIEGRHIERAEKWIETAEKNGRRQRIDRSN